MHWEANYAVPQKDEWLLLQLQLQQQQPDLLFPFSSILHADSETRPVL
jgi:hypothetical protein